MSANSFRPKVSARRRAFARLVGDIHQELGRVLDATPGVPKAEIARRLGVDRSLVTRRLNGTSNMTLESLSDLAWAMDQTVEVRLTDRAGAATGNTDVQTQPDPPGRPAIKTTYDPNGDALYVSLSERPLVESEQVAPGVVFEFDADHRLIGIAVLNARARLGAEVLAAAE